MNGDGMASNGDNIHPRRENRLREPPSSRNAQGLFPPDACLFMGNLCSKIPKEQQERDIEDFFSMVGRCYAKVKIDKGSALHGAFVQFERVEHANRILDRDHEHNPIILHDRKVRVERARGQRTARLSHRSGADITEEEARQVLGLYGPLEGMCLDSVPLLLGENTATATCLVTFRFVEDYNDAIKDFSRNPHFDLAKTKHEGNPFANGGTPGPELKESHTSQPPHEHGRKNGFAHHRNGSASYRGNGRGFERRFPPRYASQGKSYNSNASQDYHKSYSQEYNHLPEQYGGSYNQSAPNHHMPYCMAPGAPACAPSANTYVCPPPNETYSYPPQGNTYNCPPPNNTYNSPASNGGDTNEYNNQQNMGPGGYNSGQYQGPFIVSSTPTTYNNAPQMCPNGYQHPPPPQNGYYPQYMPQGGQMNGQYPQQFVQEQCYPQGPGYFIPQPGPNMNMPYMAHPYNAAAPPYYPVQPAPPANNPTQAPERTDALTEPAQALEPEQESSVITAILCSDAKSNGDKTNGESGSEKAPDSDKKEEPKAEEDQVKTEEPTESANSPAPSTDTTFQPKQNGNHHDSDADAEEENLTNEKPTGNDTPVPPENSPISRDSSSSPTANGGNSPGFTLPPVSEYVRQVVLERGLDLSQSALDAATRELEEEFTQMNIKKHEGDAGVDADANGAEEEDEEDDETNSQTSTLVGA